ncbi:MAG: cation-translocating P-type ATPase C-terminal domain-containing protein, partial [Candidatus Micrarchaeota archaeon]|nr:cation-translocating P-type ATPase C-terminal domain-containing protein [Candidatus Micrarchaeota archaeon]
LATLALMEMFNVFNSRSLEFSAFRSALIPNKWLFMGLAASVTMLMAVIYWAPLQELFQTVPLAGGELLTAFGLGSSILLFGEARKALWPRLRDFVRSASMTRRPKPILARYKKEKDEK